MEKSYNLVNISDKNRQSCKKKLAESNEVRKEKQ